MNDHRTIIAGDDTLSRVRKIIMEHLGTDADQTVAEARLCPPEGEAHTPTVGTSAGDGHLGCDSLDIVELTMAFEEEFRVEITDDESVKLNEGTVGDCVTLIDGKLAAAA